MSPKRMRDLDLLDRPREKIERFGAASLKDEELISAILGRGTRNRDIISISREVAALLEKKRELVYDDLVGIAGIGPSKASVLMACFELSRRYGNFRESVTLKICKPEDLFSVPEVQNLRGKKQEHFLVVTLNGANEVIMARTITMGLLNHSLVHPREVYADAITDRAGAIIAVHNHPSGNTQPSDQDINITRQIFSAGAILGIPLLDHVIVSRDRIISLRELGFFPD